jgi:hypothetical protein
MGIAVSSTEVVKAAKTAHMRMAKELFSIIIRRRNVLVDIMIH